MAINQLIKCKKTQKNANYLIGRVYFEGNGVEKNYKQAYKCFEEHAKKTGYYSSCNFLGFMLLNGLGIKKNIPNAIKYFKKSTYANPRIDNYAYYAIQYIVENVLSSKKDEEAIDELEKMVNISKNSPFYLNQFDKALELEKELSDKIKTTTDPFEFNDCMLQKGEKVLPEIALAAINTCIEAKLKMAMFYLQNNYIASDYDKAKKYVDDGIKENIPEAYYILAYMYDNGKGVPCDPWLAYINYNRALSKGYEFAKYAVIKAQLEGHGCPKNVKNAISELKKLDKNNDLQATFMYANYLLQSNDKKHLKQANILMEKCINGNHAQAIYCKALKEDSLKGGDNKNYQEVYDLYAKAMENGCYEAAVEMGNYQIKGVLGEINEILGITLINKALAHKCVSAYYAIYELADIYGLVLEYKKIDYLDMAGRAGYKPAMEKLFEIYTYGLEGEVADPVLAFYWKEQLALLGDTSLYEEIIDTYKNSELIGKDAQKFAYWNCRLIKESKDSKLVKQAEQELKNVVKDAKGNWIFTKKPRTNKQPIITPKTKRK